MSKTKMKWSDYVTTKFKCSEFASNLTLFTKINELADADPREMRKSHGKVKFKNKIECDHHWTCGDYRFFGNVIGSMNEAKLELLGYGLHSGKGNSNYKVYLPNNKSTTATTA